MLIIPAKDPLGVEVVAAIRAGDVVSLQRLLEGHPGLATAEIGDTRDCNGVPRSLLHVATDWPGHFPNAPATVAALIAAGADVNARCTGPHTETPLHWAASSDDVAVLDALLDAGADIEAVGAVIGGGTPLADAVAFGQWRAARLLVERGARTTLWQAAALGLMDRVEKHFATDNPSTLSSWSPRPPQPGAPLPDEITNAFWCACHGGQRQSAEYLLGQGADPNWIGYDGLTPVDAARRSDAGALVEWLVSRGAKSATERK
ncbi:MAG TPA: ankyrin repeat domain-containing protein [Verrucomicrobiota bacterium]|nr:ankyrin repeat domain-containing protein [Verrucomicrobiota bacterium]